MFFDSLRVKQVRKSRWLILAAVVAYASLCWVGGRPSAEARVEKGVHPIIVPGLKYLGNASCAGAECHSADEAKEQSGQMIGDEANIWAEADPHALAYETLANDDSKKIADALKVGSAAESSRCLSCHAIDAPAEQRGEKFALINAVGCESCHGPAEKWMEPHKKAGWTAEQRQAAGPGGLLKEHGLVDTSNLSVRAHTCVACHLQIDKDLIDAGHPPLEFELYAYNYYVSKKPDKEYRVHWGDGLEPPKFWDAKLWAAGQAAAHEASSAMVEQWKTKGWETAEAQALADIYAGGLEVVKKHFGTETATGVTDAQFTTEKAVAAAKDVAALAPKAKDQIHRRIITYGVAALTSSAYAEAGKDMPDAFWDAYYGALEAGDGDAFKQSLDAMTAAAAELK